MIRPEPDSVLSRMGEAGLEKLSEAQQHQLGDILEEYLTDLEACKPVDREAIIRSHPELADVLQSYLSSIETLFKAGVSVGSTDGVQNSLASAMMRSETVSLQSQRLGDYLIKDEIGRGGMGVVYAAEQISLGRQVALKILPFAAVLDQRQVTRFKNEAQAAAGLHHPNIVPVYGVGCERGVHYFSMQRIAGQSLEQAVSDLRDADVGAAKVPRDQTTDRHFSTEQSISTRQFSRSVARLGRQAADALHHAHENGVIHRDIKPSNLLLDGSGKLWVTDFGLARVASPSNLTVSGDMIGTARYMSPEQAGGRLHEVDHRSDVYSLGITLYELLTLRTAFDADTKRELLRRVEDETPIPPRRLNPAIPVDLETIVLKAIEKDRDNRYASAGELAEDLGHFLDGRPTLAKRPGVPDRLYRWAGRHRKAVLTYTLLTTVALVGIATSTLMIRSEKGRTKVEARRAALYLRETQRVVDNFGALVDERLEHLPGSGVLRIELLGELEKYYSAFIEQAGDDPSFAIDLATTQFRLASVHQRLGDFDQAFRGYKNALAGFESLANQSPSDPDRVADIALCHNNLAQVLVEQGEQSQAQSRYRQAIDMYQSLADDRQPRGLSGLGRTRMNLGLLLSAQHAPQATKLLTQARVTLASLANRTPEDWRLQGELALCENNLASVILSQDIVRAEELLRSAVSRYERLTEVRPASPGLRSDQALAISNLAFVVAHGGDQLGSAELFRDGIEVRKRLINLEPAVSAHVYDLAIAHQQLGQILITAGKWQEASDAYLASRNLLERLIARRSEDHRSHSALGCAAENLGLIQRQMGNQRAAIKHFKQAVVSQQAAVELSPQIRDYHQLLAQAQSQHAADAGDAELTSKQSGE